MTAEATTAAIVKIPEKCRVDIQVSAEFIAERDQYLSTIASIPEVIDNDADFHRADEVFAESRRLVSKADRARKDAAQPFTSVAKQIKGLFDTEAGKLGDAAAALGTRINAYRAKQRAAEAKEKARIEAEHQAEIQRQVAEQEAARLLAEATADLFSEPVKEPEPAPAPAPAPTPVQAPTTKAPVSRCTTTAKRVTYTIADDAEVGRQFLDVSKPKIAAYQSHNLPDIKRALDKAGVDDVTIGGITFTYNETIRNK